MDEVKKHLEEYGVAVICDVIKPSDCDKYRAGFEQWLQLFPNNKQPFHEYSLIQSYNIAHHESTWSVRLGVKNVFEKLWGTHKLHSSTDGIAIGQPPETGNNNFEEKVPGSREFHLDQCSKRVGLHAYQGALYLEQSTEDDWCFQVLLRSHKFHSDFFETHADKEGIELSGDEFRRLSPEEQTWYHSRGCTVKRIAVPKGGMVLWDSRTVHAGAPPKRNRADPTRWRFVVFVSMTPAIWSTPEIIEKKRKAYNELCVSFHWSTLGFGLFEKKPKTPQDINELPDNAKTNEARLLVGDLSYDFNDGQANGPEWVPTFLC